MRKHSPVFMLALPPPNFAPGPSPPGKKPISKLREARTGAVHGARTPKLFCSVCLRPLGGSGIEGSRAADASIENVLLFQNGGFLARRGFLGSFSLLLSPLSAEQR